MKTKYGFIADNLDLQQNVEYFTNQLWKLIPMRENDENWKGQLDTLIVELVGFSEILCRNEQFFILLAKLEGLRHLEVEFKLYRKTVFETMSLLKEITKDECV